MIARPPLGQILGFIFQEPDARDRARSALEAHEAVGVPWYLRLLTGIGAWAGGGFMLSFILAIVGAILDVDRFDELAIGLGVIIMIGAVLLRRGVTGVSVGAQFVRQLAQVVCFAGQLLFIGGVGGSTRSGEAAAVAALIASVALIAVYPDRVQRFCSAVIAAGSLWFLIREAPYAADGTALALTAGVLFLGRGAPREVIDDRAEIVEPVMYGLVIALLGLLIASTAVTMFGLSQEVKELRVLLVGAPTAIGFSLALMWLTASIFNEHGVPPSGLELPLSFAAIVAIGWITQSTPAITATMLMLALGFDRRARALIALSILFFLTFGTAYYYGLHLTLLQKSGILAASGVLCLMVSAFVRARYGAPVTAGKQGEAA